MSCTGASRLLTSLEWERERLSRQRAMLGSEHGCVPQSAGGTGGEFMPGRASGGAGDGETWREYLLHMAFEAAAGKGTSSAWTVGWSCALETLAPREPCAQGTPLPRKPSA